MRHFTAISALPVLALLGMAVYGDIWLDTAFSGRGTGEPDGVSRPARKEMIAEKSGMDILSFGSGDSLRGKLLSLDPAQGTILWKSAEASQEILFRTENVVNVKIGNHKAYHDRDMVIELTNGDSLSGNLLALDLSDASLDTRYGGILTIKRHMIKGMYLEKEMHEILFIGPGSIEDWRLDNRFGGVATIDDGAINFSGVCSIARDMNIGDMARIDFNFEFPGHLQFQMMLYTGEQTWPPSNRYQLYLSPGYTSFQRLGPGGSEDLGSVQSDELLSGKGRLTLLADRGNGKFTLLIDGAVSAQWNDTGRIEGAGSHVHFANEGQGNLKIRDLQVSVWDGKLPEASDVAEDLSEDLILFFNGDKLSGKLQAVENDMAKIKTEYFEVSVPLERIKHIQTASPERHLARRNAGDVRFFFPDGNSLTLDVSSISDGNVIGKSENLGEVQLALNAFKSFDMHIYRESAE